MLGILGLACFPLFLQFHRSALGNVNAWESTIPLFGPSAWVRAHTGLEWLPQLWIAALLAPLLMLALAVFVEWVIQRLALDPADDAWTSLAWAMRSWGGWLTWLASLAAAIALSTAMAYAMEYAASGGSFGPADMIAFLPAIAGYLGMVFFAGNAANLGPASPPAIWRPRWPGGFAVIAVISTLALSHAWGAFVDARDLSLAVGIAIEFVLWIPSLVVTLFCLLAWLNRSKARDFDVPLRRALQPRLIAAAWVQQVRFGLIVLPFVLPILASTVLLNFIVPQAEDSLRQAGTDLGSFWHAWIVAMRWLSSWWWLLVLTLAWFVVVPPARLLVQLDAVSVDARGDSA
jgi:hypothetical protein